MDAQPPQSRSRHRAASFLAILVIGLISAGALVTSKGAGLSVPDWPTSFGSFNPPNWWRISTVRAEHGHRLFAGTVALLAVGLAIWTARVEPRRWVRWLAQLAVAAVLLQALLGGLTVLLFLPTAISVGHAGLAELFLGLVVTVAVVTGEGWHRRLRFGGDYRWLARCSRWTAALVYVQILVGAVMRHSGAGLAIPDFPLVFGGFLPPEWTPAIAIHFVHRIGALVVTGAVLTTVAVVWRRFRGERRLLLPALAMAGLVPLQITLGALVVLSRRMELPNTIHVATGAGLWASSLVLALFAHRLGWLVERASVASEASPAPA